LSDAVLDAIAWVRLLEGELPAGAFRPIPDAEAGAGTLYLPEIGLSEFIYPAERGRVKAPSPTATVEELMDDLRGGDLPSSLPSHGHRMVPIPKSRGPRTPRPNDRCRRHGLRGTLDRKRYGTSGSCRIEDGVEGTLPPRRRGILGRDGGQVSLRAKGPSGEPRPGRGHRLPPRRQKGHDVVYLRHDHPPGRLARSPELPRRPFAHRNRGLPNAPTSFGASTRTRGPSPLMPALEAARRLRRWRRSSPSPL
jgi:hypothetical protein